ncbi:Uncharacterised protein [Escherichia coli]|nr:hypothetical protein ESMG_02720 [Escherichia coli M919]SQJ60915.1 Uncharacterised protein [Escherichia coli]SQR04021.1 Uncharacterised protein [Escherichia coli]SRB91389.1 Uncharacterised protein [Escherichia coli]
MLRNDVIQSVNQFWFSERDMRGALLKVSDAEHLIFIVLFTLNRLDVVIQMNGDVFPVVGDRFAAEQVQHSFQIGKSIGLLPGDKMKPPPVSSHQIVDDNFITKFTGGVGFVIPVQPSEDVDHPSLKHLILILVQLFKCAQDVRFADFRKIIVLQ